MIKSKKYKLPIAVILVCVCAPVLGQEPNQPKSKLKFEISSERKTWTVMVGKTKGGKPLYFDDPGPTKPTHVAEVLIMGDNKEICYIYDYVVGNEGRKHVSKAWVFPGIDEGGKMILQTSAGRSMTQKQREFVEKSDFFLYAGKSNKVRNYSQYHLYAVSEMDAKKMVDAFIEILTEEADERMQFSLNQHQELQEKIAEIKKELPEKQKQAKELESKYEEINNARFFSLNKHEAYEKAKETMLKMDNMLDTFEIELAGIREKMKTIKRFRSGQETVRNRTNQVNYRLDEMFVEQMVELRGVEARKKAALLIRDREKAFCDCYQQWFGFDREVIGLKRSLSESEKDLSRLEGKLANLEPNMLPPNIYQNTVTIYPVRVKED